MTEQLLLGCGVDRQKRLRVPGTPYEWDKLTTLDINETHNPDVVHDLNIVPWPFLDDTFDEVHAYEVLEHIGQQGDYKSFFATFSEIYRILKPEGHLLATVPAWNSIWAFGDPGHTRVINEGSLAFLNQDLYGKPPMSDYRDLWKGNLVVETAGYDKNAFIFLLRKHVKTPDTA